MATLAIAMMLFTDFTDANVQRVNNRQNNNNNNNAEMINNYVGGNSLFQLCGLTIMSMQRHRRTCTSDNAHNWFLFMPSSFKHVKVAK